MRPLSDGERYALLHSYLATEPTFDRNCETFAVAVNAGSRHVVFRATNLRNGETEGVVLVARETWDGINTGLAMAWLLNTVLDRLEAAVGHGIVVSADDLQTLDA